MEFQQAKHDLARRGLPEVDGASVDARVTAALLSADDPGRWAKAIDLTVVLRELIDTFQGRLARAVLAGEAESELGQRFGARMKLTLIVCSSCEVLGPIAKIQDWRFTSSASSS